MDTWHLLCPYAHSANLARWFHKYAHTVAFANNDDASLQLCGTDFQNVFLVLLFRIFIFACTQNMQKVLTVCLILTTIRP